MPDTNGLTLAPLKTSSEAISIATLATLTTYTPTNVCWVRPQLHITGMNGAAATVTVHLRNSTDSITLYRESAAKDVATDTGMTFLLPPFLTIANKAYAIQVLSSNASDTGTTCACNWLDAYFVQANVAQWLDTIPATPNVAGVPAIELRSILATALTETSAGYLAAAFKKLFDVAVPVLTGASVNQSGDCYSSTQRQQMAREAHGVSGTVWHVAYNAGETMGNDGFSWATAKLTAGAGVKTVIEAATAGDLVLIGAGTFNLGAVAITIPASVTVRGAGRDVTNLTGSAWPCMSLSSNSHLEGVSFTSATQFPIGGINGTVAGATARDCRFFGTLDSAALYYVIGVQFFDCEFEGLWDGLATNTTAAQSIDCFNCHIYLTTGSGHGERGIYLNSANAIVNMFGGTITVTAAADQQADGVVVMSGTVRLFNVKIRTSGGSTNYDLRQSGAGVLVAVGCKYDRSKTSGTIIDIDRIATDTGGNAYADVKLVKTVDADTALSARVDASQTGLDLADGGRLDLILDAVAADVAGLDGATMRGTDNAYTGIPPTSSGIASQVRTELTTELGRIDAAITTRHAAGAAVAKSPATLAAGDIATNAIDAASIKADAVTKIQAGLAKTADVQLTVLPATSTALDNGRLSPVYITAYQNTKISCSIAVLDANDEPVTLTGKQLALVAWNKDAPTVALISMSSAGESPELSISGDYDNVVTIAGAATHTATAQQLDYRIVNVTDSIELVHGVLDIEAGAPFTA